MKGYINTALLLSRLPVHPNKDGICGTTGTISNTI